TRQGRQSPCRSPQLLALHERPLRQPETQGSLRDLRFRKGTRSSRRSATVIPSLPEIARQFGIGPPFVAIAAAGVITAGRPLSPVILPLGGERASSECYMQVRYG